MAYLKSHHPIARELTHHPVAALVAVVLAVALLLVLAGGPLLGPSTTAGIELVP